MTPSSAGIDRMPERPQRRLSRPVTTIVCVVVCTACALGPGAGAADAQRDDVNRAMLRAMSAVVPRIHHGAVELGVGSSFSSVEGSTRATVALRAGRFVRAGAGLATYEVELGYAHQASLDAVDVALALGWVARPREGAVYPFLALAGGLRQEWLGSFRQARYPVGLDAGVRFMAGPRVAFRVEYRFRRVLDDPVADFTEHQFMSGLSLFFRNVP